MSAVTATLAGRRAAEALMVDACTITTPGSPATNDTTGVVTNTPTTKYTGRCKLQRPSGDGRREVAEASVVVAPLELHLPVVGSEGLAEGDVVTVTASALDADLVGRVFRIAGPARASLKTARRLQVTEVAS
jgi:hypothetical protein